MKILYIYRDYKGRRKKYGEMMSSCGHDVNYLEILEKKQKNQVSSEIIKKYNPELLWIYSHYYISYKVIPEKTLEYVKKRNIPIVLYGTTGPDVPYMDILDVWKQIDFLFVHNQHFCSFLKTKGLNAYYMPLGFYPDQYYKKISKKKYDVSFMGTSQTKDIKKYDKRAEYLKFLDHYNIAIYGESFKNKVNKIPVYSYKGHEIQREIYSKTKINLDLPFPCSKNKIHEFYKNQIHIKNRFFEIPATGNFLLTVRCPEFLDIFPEDTVGYYDDNTDSLKENVDKYLKDKNLRKKMSEKAYKLVHEKHTYLHRFKDMFKIINEEKC